MSPMISILASAAEGAAKAAHDEPSGLSTLGGLIALIVTGIGLIAVGGAAVMMIVGAINGRRQLVTSWSMEQEATFSSFEQRSQAAHAVLAIGVYFGVKPDLKDQEQAAKSMNMSNLTKKEKDAAPAPAAAPAEKKGEGVAPAEKKVEEPKTEDKDETEDKAEDKADEKKEEK
jgi:hypothetical protein